MTLLLFLFLIFIVDAAMAFMSLKNKSEKNKFFIHQYLKKKRSSSTGANNVVFYETNFNEQKYRVLPTDESDAGREKSDEWRKRSRKRVSRDKEDYFNCDQSQVNPKIAARCSTLSEGEEGGSLTLCSRIQ